MPLRISLNKITVELCYLEHPYLEYNRYVKVVCKSQPLVL